MQRLKLITLYILLAMVMLCGVFTVYMSLPQEETQIEEEPYEFAQIQLPLPDSTEEPESEFKLQYDRAALIEQNDDFYGWLYIPDTEINFPVVQGEDNSFYLNHGFSKAYSAYGCPFLDTRTPPESDNLVIHGHNMGNNRKEIFSTLLYYQEEAYAKDHSMIYFSCPDRKGEEYELFAVCNVNVNDESLNYIVSGFDSEDSRNEFLSLFQQCSLYPTEAIPEGNILVLSTCNRAYGGDNRLLIIAVENK